MDIEMTLELSNLRSVRDELQQEIEALEVFRNDYTGTFALRQHALDELYIAYDQLNRINTRIQLILAYQRDETE
jgi:hypothetical protein